MDEFVKACGSKLIWIDHHKAAMEKFPDLWSSDNIPGVRSIEKAACVLTWEFTHPEHVPPPAAVAYIGDKDIWRFEYVETRAFSAGFSLMVKTPGDVAWDTLLSSEYEGTVNKIISIGKLLLESQSYKIRKHSNWGRLYFPWVESQTCKYYREYIRNWRIHLQEA